MTSGGSGRRPLPSLSLIRGVLAEAAPGAVGLAHGVPGHPTPEPVREALRRAVEERAWGYTANGGRSDLRRAVAVRRPHHGADADSAIVTAGSQEALALAVLGLVGPGDEVILPELAYPSYEALARFAGARPVRVPPEGIRGALTPATRLVIVASPANPTGAVLDGETLEGLAALASERGFFLLSDEVYEEIWLGASRPPVPAGERVLHVGGISKSLAAPGLRLGWLVADPGLVEELVALHQHLVTCAPALSQAAALAGLELPVEELDGVRRHYRERWEVTREALRAHLPEAVSWRDPAGAFYVLLDVGRAVGRETAAFALGQARAGTVVVVPGEAFGPAGAGSLRLSFSAPEEDIREGVRRLGRALEVAAVRGSGA